MSRTTRKRTREAIRKKVFNGRIRAKIKSFFTKKKKACWCGSPAVSGGYCSTHLTLFVCMLLPFLSQAQSYDTIVQDTTFSSMLVGECGIKKTDYIVSVVMRDYLARFEHVNITADIFYVGEAIIDNEYRECVVIQRLTFVVSGRRK